MTPEEFVAALYSACLGRAPDAEGLAHWTVVMSRTGDPTSVLAGILGSEEYRSRGHTDRSTCDDAAIAVQALRLLGRRPRVVDVGAQSLGIGSHPYSPLAAFTPLEIIGFDPLAERLRERAETERDPGLTLLPYAVGDGASHTLYINDDDATSSLYPLNEAHNRHFNHLAKLRTVRTESVLTRRLDDILPEAPIDFLKIDVQGGELMVLSGAERLLGRTAIVHCEVEFSPIYLRQPLYSEVHNHLTARGFAFIDFATLCRYHYLVPSGRTDLDRLLWADAVFFRDSNEPDTLAAQALVAATVYRKPTLAQYLLGLIGPTR